MIKQYPHILTYTTAGTESSFNADGHLVAGTPGEAVSQACRYEDLRENSRFRGVDNETHIQQGTIYMPKDAANVPGEGAYVVVEGMFKGKIGKPYVGQLNISIKV